MVAKYTGIAGAVMSRKVPEETFQDRTRCHHFHYNIPTRASTIAVQGGIDGVKWHALRTALLKGLAKVIMHSETEVIRLVVQL